MVPRGKKKEQDLSCLNGKFSESASPSPLQKYHWRAYWRRFHQHMSKGDFCEPEEAAP
jgi:hypothetical protein